MQQPIYYVISEQERIPNVWMNILRIIKVIECDLSEVEAVSHRETDALYNAGRMIECRIYVREPANPFKDFKGKE